MEDFLKSVQRCNSCVVPITQTLSFADAPPECISCAVDHVAKKSDISSDNARSAEPNGGEPRKLNRWNEGIDDNTTGSNFGKSSYCAVLEITPECRCKERLGVEKTKKIGDRNQGEAASISWTNIEKVQRHDQELRPEERMEDPEESFRDVPINGTLNPNFGLDCRGSTLRKQSSKSTTSIATTVTILSDHEGGGEGDAPCGGSPEGRDEGRTPSGDSPEATEMGGEEAWWSTLCQVAVPFFLAGSGTLGAGLVLGTVQSWPVFEEISAIFVLVPALLGLKGNLDTCLASRMSTLANLGKLGKWSFVFPIVWGNIALVQVQAIVAGFLVSLFAIAVAAAMDGDIPLKHAAVLSASSIATATCCCFILDFLLIGVIIGSKKLNMNPDNIAAPIAASLGDIMSLGLLSLIASTLYKYHDIYPWIPFVIAGVFLMVLLPMWVLLVLSNEYVKAVLTFGWVPILSALFISGLGGLVLDSVVSVYNGFVVFQPIISGIGGNLVSIQSSRISTMLHQSSLMGILPPHSAHVLVSPWRALVRGLPHAATSRILLGLSIPGHLVFIFAADYLHTAQSTLTWQFVLTYLTVSTLQISILLYLAHVLVHIVWRRKIDPDSATIPYLTSISDFVGSGFLALAFMFLHAVGKDYSG